MSQSTRVTITLPADILLEIDIRETNRSRFVLEAVRQELQRRQKEELERSLASPHPESQGVEALGLREWFATAKNEAAELLDLAGGTEVCWVPNVGWTQERP